MSDATLADSAAPIAATEAAAIGAHREAAHHLETALCYRHRLEPAEAAGLLLRLGDELMTIGQPEAAVGAFNDAAATFASLAEDAAREPTIAQSLLRRRDLADQDRASDSVGRVGNGVAKRHGEGEPSRSPH